MVDIKARSVVGYIVEILAGLGLVLGVLMLVASIYKGDFVGIIIAVVLVGVGIFVFKRPGR